MKMIMVLVMLMAGSAMGKQGAKPPFDPNKPYTVVPEGMSDWDKRDFELAAALTKSLRCEALPSGARTCTMEYKGTKFVTFGHEIGIEKMGEGAWIRTFSMSSKCIQFWEKGEKVPSAHVMVKANGTVAAGGKNFLEGCD